MLKMGLEKEPSEEHEKEFENITVLGDAKVEEFSGIRDKLTPQETVELFVGIKTDSKGKNLLVVTNQRLLTFDSSSKLLGDKNEFKDIRIDAIDDMSVEERKGFDILEIKFGGQKQKYMVPEGTGVQISGHIRDVQGSLDPAERLEKISEQKELGHISEEEFEEKKDELMDRI